MKNNVEKMINAMEFIKKKISHIDAKDRETEALLQAQIQ